MARTSNDPELSVTLREAFLEGLDLPPNAVVGDLAFAQHPNWDSLGHMSLVASIERKFGLTLDSDDVAGLESFVAAIAILRKRSPLSPSAATPRVARSGSDALQAQGKEFGGRQGRVAP